MNRRSLMLGESAFTVYPAASQAALPLFWGVVRLLGRFALRGAVTRGGAARAAGAGLTVGAVSRGTAARAGVTSTARSRVAQTIVRKRAARPYAADNPSAARRAISFLNNVADVYDLAQFIGMSDEVKRDIQGSNQDSHLRAIAAYYCLIVRNDPAAAMSQFVDPTPKYFSYMADPSRRAGYHIERIQTVEVDHAFGGRIARVGVWGRNHPNQDWRWWEIEMEMVETDEGGWLFLAWN